LRKVRKRDTQAEKPKEPSPQREKSSWVSSWKNG
jgi:hypothetical protein